MVSLMDESPAEEQSRPSLWQNAEIRRLSCKLDIAHRENGRLTAELREANQQIVYVNDEDSFSVRLGDILVHDQGLGAHIKAMFRMSPFQRKALIRELLEDMMELDEDDDKSCLDMEWVWDN